MLLIYIKLIHQQSNFMNLWLAVLILCFLGLGNVRFGLDWNYVWMIWIRFWLSLLGGCFFNWWENNQKTFILLKTKEEALRCPSSKPSKGWAEKLEHLWVLWILKHGSECVCVCVFRSLRLGKIKYRLD